MERIRYVTAHWEDYNTAQQRVRRSRPSEQACMVDEIGFADHIALATDELSGYAIEYSPSSYEHSLVGVFSCVPGRLKGIIEDAMRTMRGMDASVLRLTCFEPLAPIYARHGFVTYAVDPWYEAFKPEGWPDEAGTPNVHHMAKVVPVRTLNR